MSSGHHEAAWRLPESDPHADFDSRHWVGLHGSPSVGRWTRCSWPRPARSGQREFRPAGQLDRLILLRRWRRATEHVGLIATASTTYNEPYNLALRFASLDHVSNGRRDGTSSRPPIAGPRRTSVSRTGRITLTATCGPRSSWMSR